MTTTFAEPRPSYIADAFFVQYNLILLGGSALFSVASASPIPLGGGLILEALYLLVAPNLPSFRRYADARYAAFAPVSESPNLDALHAGRVAGFERGLNEIRARLRAPQALPLALALDRLDAAAPGFAALCELDQRVQQSLVTTPAPDLEAELARLQAECDVEPDAMQKVTLRLGQNAVKRKLAQRQEQIGMQRAAESKLQRVEQTIEYLRSHGPGALSEAELVQQLDAISGALAPLGQAQSEHLSST